MSHISSTNTKPNVLEVSPEFKKEATKCILAIAAFIAVYLLLIVAAIGLVVGSVYAGIFVISIRVSFYTLLIGLGLAGFGVMVVVFLFKFLFSSSKEDATNRVEITAKDEPSLFEMIYNLADETGARRPKKVFLIPDVNASVFYHSSFWSMFFPVRKNLNIGLGLVNMVNVSELKAVIAHEFGHFSQKSMKVGSWVYQMNKVIYDMLYNNQDYANALGAMSGAHAIFSFFASITVKVVQGIQWVLQQMFTVINKSYMGLSQQMEFHADLVAASVCGSNNIISALRRAEFAEVGYAATLDLCNEAWKQKKVVNDFFTDHRLVVTNLARRNQISLVEGMPVIEEVNNTTVTSRINCKNQWASHPPLEERNEYLQPFGLTAEVNTASAWSLFNEKEKWKEQLTKKIYTAIPQEEIQGSLTENEFEELMLRQEQQFSFPPLFKEYYNGRIIAVFDVEALVNEPFVIKNFEEIFTEEIYLLPRRIEILAQDIALLEAISKKEITTRSFDFDGEKRDANEASEVKSQLETELEEKKKELLAADQRAFRYFYAIAPLAEAEKLKRHYQEYFATREKSDAFVARANQFMSLLSPIYRGETLGVDTINNMITNFKAEDEPWLKKEWQYWMDAGAFEKESALKEGLQKFIEANYQYFFGQSFLEGELGELNRLVQEGWNAIYNFVFTRFKTITEVQAQLQQEQQIKKEAIAEVFKKLS
jgi:Zn-dependent protease with chaperone function